MEPPLNSNHKSHWSLLAQILCCQLFHLFQEETHLPHLLTKATTWAERITDPHITSVPPGCLSTAQLSIPPLKAVSSDQPEQRKQVFPLTNGGEKNCFKAVHQLCHDSEIWGLFFFRMFSFFLLGGWKGGREWILGVSPHPLIQRRHLSESRTCGTCGLLWKRTSKVPKGLHHVLGFMDTASLRDFWWIPRYQTDMDFSPRAPNKAMS